MGDEEDGDAPVADRLDELPGLATRLRVEARRQLVEDRDLRLAHERERDREALLLATGQVPVLRVALLGQPEVVDEGPGVFGILVERCEQLDRLHDGHAVRQLALLELDADDRPQPIPILSRIEPEDADRPAVGLAQAGDRLDCRRLASTVRAEDAENLAFLDGEGHAVDGRVLAVVLGEVGDFDDVHAPSIATSTSRVIGEAAAFRGVVGWPGHPPIG